MWRVNSNYIDRAGWKAPDDQFLRWLHNGSRTIPNAGGIRWQRLEHLKLRDPDTKQVCVPKTSSGPLRVGIGGLFSGRLVLQQSKVVVGMLQVIFVFDSIAACRRSTGQRQIAFVTAPGMAGTVGACAFDP